MDRVFKALADESRRNILSALCREPMVAGELGRLVGLAPNAVSFHLKELKSADLVSIRREGRYLRYQINAVVLADWLMHVREVFEHSAAVAERVPHSALPSSKPSIGSQPAPQKVGIPSNNDILPTELL